MPDELGQNNQQNNDALIQQVEELTKVINTQFELEQQEKELSQEEEQLLIDQQEAEALLLEGKIQEENDFRETVLESIDQLNESSDLSTLFEQQTALIEQQSLMIEMYEETFPAVKQASEWSIIFLGLIPLFMVVRWLGQMFDSAFR